LSIATGSNAYTLISQLLLLLLCKRSHSRLDPSELILKKKKDKEDDSSIVTAINRSIEAQKSSIIKAIEILAEEYYNRLTEDDFGRATDILSDKMKASVFITLLRKNIRDR
jgi:hypothetical protein